MYSLFLNYIQKNYINQHCHILRLPKENESLSFVAQMLYWTAFSFLYLCPNPKNVIIQNKCRGKVSTVVGVIREHKVALESCSFTPCWLS